MRFHLGKPILVMLLLATVCGVLISLRPAKPHRADLVLWVFSDSHAHTYTSSGPGGPSLVDSFKTRTGMSIDVQLVFSRAENVRLTSIFMSDVHGPSVPDLVEVEIGQVGKFFRPPTRDVGFVPLNEYLKRTGPREIASLDAAGQKGWHARLKSDRRIYTHDGARWNLDPSRSVPDMWIDRILHNRFAPWSKGDAIFGVPHDVHPVALAFRHDLFMEAGIDLPAESSDPARPLTWPRFHELCLKFKRHWESRGQADRWPIELHTGSAEDLFMLLLQRRLNPIDKDGGIQLASPKVAQTMAFYAQLVAGPRRIAGQSGVAEAAISQDLNSGNICAYMTPDWRVRLLKDMTAVEAATGRKSLEGKMRLIPLPVFQAGDAPTATWGGTMIGIPRACPNPDAAWKLIEHLYLSEEGLRARIRETKILPPLIEQWDDPAYDRPDPFFGGQKVDRLFIDLAHRIPPRFITPATSIASAELAFVLYKAIDHANSKGGAGLEAACQEWLKEAADDLAGRIAWGKFE